MQHPIFTKHKKAKGQEAGFSLIELLLAISMFVVVISVVATIFASTSSYQKRIIAFQDAENNARYIIETVSREIRLAKDIGNGQQDNNGPSFRLTNYSGGKVNYCASGPDGSCDNNGMFLARQILNADGSVKTSQVLNTSTVRIEDLKFITNNFTQAQRIITVAFAVCSAASAGACDPNVNIRVQTSISARIY